MTFSLFDSHGSMVGLQIPYRLYHSDRNGVTVGQGTRTMPYGKKSDQNGPTVG